MCYLKKRHLKNLTFLAGGLLLASASLFAQGGGGGRGAAQAPKSPKDAAPADLTGYWTTVVTEDWRFRMVTPPKGDFAGVPLNPAGTRVASDWDMTKDISSGEQCRAFGAAGIMRMPVRLHITWQDENTLKIDIDNGNQTRLLHFDKAVTAPNTDWQGLSTAEWETMQAGQGQAAGGGGRGGGAPPLSGSLKVMTTKMKHGYLRRNGVPYSGNAVMTEFFDRTTGPGAKGQTDTWLVLTSSVDDPQYLQMPFMLTTHFKKEADGAKFSPRPCEVTAPVEILGAN